MELECGDLRRVIEAEPIDINGHRYMLRVIRCTDVPTLSTACDLVVEASGSLNRGGIRLRLDRTRLDDPSWVAQWAREVLTKIVRGDMVPNEIEFL